MNAKLGNLNWRLLFIGSMIVLAVFLTGCSSGGDDTVSVTPAEPGESGNGGSTEVPDSPDLGQWEPTGYAGGGLFTAIAVDPDDTNTVYACSDVSGIYRSDDRGESWSHKSSGLQSHAIASIVVDPSNNNRLWAATPLGLHRSEDRGDNWTLVNGDIRCYEYSSFQPIAIDSTGNVILVAAHELPEGEYYEKRFKQATLTGRLYRSSDGGSSWNLVNGLLQSYPPGHAVPFGRSRSVYAGASLAGGKRPGNLALHRLRRILVGFFNGLAG